MKGVVVFIFASMFALGVYMVFNPAYAYYPTDPDGNPMVPVNLAPECKARNDITIFAYDHRDQVTQDEALEIVKDNWNKTWSSVEGLEWHDYVDMQRIVRDAFRTNSNGDYIRECCDDEIILARVWKETFQCAGDEVDAIPVIMEEDETQRSNK